MTDLMRILPYYFDDPEFHTLAPSNALLKHRTKQQNESQDKKVDEEDGAPKADAPFSEKEVSEFQDSIAELKYTSLQMEKDVAEAWRTAGSNVFLASALSQHLEGKFKWAKPRRKRLFAVLSQFLQYRSETDKLPESANQFDVISYFTTVDREYENLMKKLSIDGKRK